MPTPSPKLTPEERRERLLEAGFPVDHVQDLPRLFDWANDRYFDGELRRPDRMTYTRAIKTRTGSYRCELKKPSALQNVHSIGRTSLCVATVIRGDIVELVDTLVHEMVHAWQYQMVEKENDLSYRDRDSLLGQPRHYKKGHAKWFHHVADRINAQFPEVLITVSGVAKDLNQTMETPDTPIHVVAVDLTAPGAKASRTSLFYCERPLKWAQAEEVKRRITSALPSYSAENLRLVTTTNQNIRRVQRLNNDGKMPVPRSRPRRPGSRRPQTVLSYTKGLADELLSDSSPVPLPIDRSSPTPASAPSPTHKAKPDGHSPHTYTPAAEPTPRRSQAHGPQADLLTSYGQQFGASSLAKTLALIAERHPEVLPESTIRAPLSASRVPHLTDQALACVLEGWKAVDAPRTAKNLASVAKLTDGASRLASPSLGEKAYLTWIEAGPKRYSFGEWCGALAGLLEERRPEWFSSQSEADTHLQRSLDLAFDGAVPEATAALGTATTSAMDSLGLADDLFNPDARSNVARALLLGASGARSSDYRNKGPSASSARPGAFDSEVPGPMAMTP